MRKSDIMSALVLVLISLGLLVYAIPTHISEGMGFGLSPKSLPLTMTLGILALSLIQGISAVLGGVKGRRNEDVDQTSVIKTSHWRFLGIVILILAVTLLAMNFLGFISGGFLFLMMFQYLAGRRNWVVMVFVAVITPVSLNTAFWYGMGVLLPQGIFY